MVSPEYLPPPMPSDTTAPFDLRSMLISEWVRDKVMTIASTSARSAQAHLGPSEIGQACPRRLAYRIAGTPIVNMPDPTKALLGTGFHEVMANGFRRLDGSARFLIEQPVSYRGVAGTVDLFDRYRHVVLDWKTTAKNRIAKYRRDGPSTNYVVQAHIYAQALIAAGERVDTVALVFIPRDGLLGDVWTWSTTPDQAKADTAIDRYHEIRTATEQGGPASVDAAPSVLCGYCPNHRPNSTDLSVACPGKG